MVKGITIPIGYNVNEFEESSKSINKQISMTKSNLANLKESLKIEYDSETMKRAQEEARKQIELTNQKAQLLRDTLKKIETDGDLSNSKVQDKYEYLQRSLNYAEANAVKAKRALLELAQQEEQVRSDHIKALCDQVDKASDKLVNAGQKLSLFSAGIAALGVKAFDSFSDFNEEVSKSDVVFGEYASEIANLAETSIANLGLAKNTIYEWTSLFGDMGTSMEQTQEQAAGMSTALTERLADLISFKNISAETAQNVGKAIYTGESESLKNIGVVMTENTLKAYAAAEGYNKLYTEMSATEKLQVRYAYFMQATSSAEGDFKRTADSASNSCKVLKESLTELATEFGEKIAPMVTPIINNLTQIIQSISELNDEQQKSIVNFGAFAVALGPALTITGKLSSVVKLFIPLFVKKTAATVADTAATTANTAAHAAASAAVGNWVSVIGIAVAALASFAIAESLTKDSSANLETEIKQATEAFNSEITSINDNNDLLEKYCNRLDELTSKESINEEQKNELARIIDKLNTSIDGLNLKYDAETNSLNKTTDAVREQIKAKKELMMNDAYESRQKEIASQIAEKELKIAEKQKEVDKYQSVLDSASAMDGLDLGTLLKIGYGDYGNKLLKSKKDLQKLKDSKSELENQWNEIQNMIKSGVDQPASGEGTATSDISDGSYNPSLMLGHATVAAALAMGSTIAKQEAKQEDAYKTALSDFKAYISERLRTAQTAAEKQIALIDAEIAKRKELQETEKTEQQLAEARAMLQYETDDDNRAELLKKISNMQEQLDEKEYQATMAAKKEAINAALAKAQENLYAMVDALARATGQDGYNYNNTVATYNNSTSAQIVVNVTGVTVGDVQKAIDGALKEAGIK